jgi:hypothetical protein
MLKTQHWKTIRNLESHSIFEKMVSSNSSPVSSPVRDSLCDSPTYSPVHEIQLPPCRVWIRIYNLPSFHWEYKYVKGLLKSFGGVYISEDPEVSRYYRCFIAVDDVAMIPSEYEYHGVRGRVYMLEIVREE